MPNSNTEDLQDYEDEDGHLGDFEKKYKDQMRQIVTQRLDLPISTLPTMLKEQIKINPDFQRRDRWDNLRQSRLIESLIMNVPIPPVFLGEDEYGFYVVLDGRQRLTAIRDFLNNTLTLKGLEVWGDLNGLTYDDLTKRGLDKHITRRFISAIAILKESSPIVKYDVFDRLNTGGVRANDMEVRNAIFRGAFTDNLHALSKNQNFRKLWDIPLDEIDAEENGHYQRMDDLSVVLRFFALRNPDDMDSSFRDYLSDFMVKRNAQYATNPALHSEDKTLFENAALNCWKIFGASAFRNTHKKQTGPKSAPISDALMIALSEVDPKILTQDAIDRIQNGFHELLSNEEFSKSISGGTNGKGAIIKRISMAQELVHSSM